VARTDTHMDQMIRLEEFDVAKVRHYTSAT